MSAPQQPPDDSSKSRFEHPEQQDQDSCMMEIPPEESSQVQLGQNVDETENKIAETIPVQQDRMEMSPDQSISIEQEAKRPKRRLSWIEEVLLDESNASSSSQGNREESLSVQPDQQQRGLDVPAELMQDISTPCTEVIDNDPTSSSIQKQAEPNLKQHHKSREKRVPTAQVQKTSQSDQPATSSASPKTKKEGTPRESLRSHMARKKKEMKEKEQEKEEKPDREVNVPESLVDPYANSIASNYITKGKTGVVYDPEVLKHDCQWDPQHPESSQRVIGIMEKLHDRGLIAQCVVVPNYLRSDLYEKLMLVHTREHFEKLKNLCQTGNLESLEFQASQYDSVYFNKYTFDAACRAASASINLVHAVAQREVMNGMAFVRPPGHHAMANEFNGYCFFNNVAVAAESCIKEGLASRILIVDIDVHHGQGTQQMFYERSDVLYFSIHRYEHAGFWPYLLESNYNYIGKGDGLGYNINVPLNATGLTDSDYLAIIIYILLPVAYEFNPDLIIVSAGYDAAIGCPEGKMMVTPGFYAHLISLLHSLARGQIAVILEGGYFVPTLVESSAMTIKALLGGPCPLLEPLTHVHSTVAESIRNVRRMLHGKWNCFDICEFVIPNEISQDSEENIFKIQYYGEKESPPFMTRKGYPENHPIDIAYYDRLNTALKERYQASHLPVIYVYEKTMLDHQPQKGDVERPERPERLTAILKVLREYGLEDRLLKTEITSEVEFEDYSPHIPHYFESINIGIRQSKDVYVNEHTHAAVLTAVNGLLTVVDNIMKDMARSGLAIIRPPGHHAEYNRPSGFCFVNNVAVAANYLQIKYNLQRILIVDFDIHHGNGTQNMFYTSSNVMYISIHRDENGKFFPPNSPRSYKNDGHGLGKGYNLNIPFSSDKMGDTEYIAAFQNIVLPAAYAFGPQFILVSAGFDAGIHDPLGGYCVYPETFGHLILMLRSLAEGKIAIALEGGYNLTTTSYGMGICAKALLGDPVIMPKRVYKQCSQKALDSMKSVINHFKQYFRIFDIIEKLPNIPVITRNVLRFSEDFYSKDLIKYLDASKIDDNEYVEREIEFLNSSHH